MEIWILGQNMLKQLVYRLSFVVTTVVTTIEPQRPVWLATSHEPKVGGKGLRSKQRLQDRLGLLLVFGTR